MSGTHVPCLATYGFAICAWPIATHLVFILSVSVQYSVSGAQAMMSWRHFQNKKLTQNFKTKKVKKIKKRYLR